MDGVIEAGMSSATARNMSILQHIPFVVPFKDRVKVSLLNAKVLSLPSQLLNTVLVYCTMCTFTHTLSWVVYKVNVTDIASRARAVAYF